MKPYRLKATGLTLVELLVTLALLAAVIGTVAATFAGGVRVWERLEARGTRDQWVQVALEQLRHDLHNLRAFEPIGFEGSYDEFAFPALVPVDVEGAPSHDEVGRLGYFFDQIHQRLCRSRHSYRTLRGHRVKDACDTVLAEVDRLRVRYGALDPDTNVLTWSESWSSAEIPLAVKIEVGYRDASTQRSASRSLLVLLPAASIS
ncbi:MAG: hypothetical protein HYY58_01090 [Candidatus Omnitrophica bacterium]|nr:hypothetical protein [Candidatus Omnitrophota bacterium]